MLVVHHLGISQSDRIVWLCEELALPYELRRYERDPATRAAPADYQALTPFGTAPVIDDGDLRLGESGAIVEYLLARYGQGRLRPAPDEAAFPDYLFWFHFAQGSLMPAMLADLIVGMLGGDGDRAALLRRRIGRALPMIEDRLSGREWLAGDTFSAADLMTVFPLTTMRVFVPRDLGAFPVIRAWLARIGARPAFRRAMERADPGFTVPMA